MREALLPSRGRPGAGGGGAIGVRPDPTQPPLEGKALTTYDRPPIPQLSERAEQKLKVKPVALQSGR
jgi:hypothetical protein